MALTAYKYTGDDGVVYQVLLDSAPASGLSYVVATGSEPYLPQLIAPRYANYKDSTLPIIYSFLITTGFASGNPPASISVSGRTLNLISAYGEERDVRPGVMPLALVGPKGDTGATGSTGATGATGAAGANGTNADIATAEVSVTAAQFKALVASPVEIIPAQGAGKFIQILASVIKHTYNGTAYTGGTGVGLYQNTALIRAYAASTYQGTSTTYDSSGSPSTVFANSVENKNVALGATANPATGTGTFKVNIDYRVLTM